MAAIQYYDVILKPDITDKSMSGMGEKKYTFLVHPEANKSRIKQERKTGCIEICFNKQSAGWKLDRC